MHRAAILKNISGVYCFFVLFFLFKAFQFSHVETICTHGFVTVMKTSPRLK